MGRPLPALHPRPSLAKRPPVTLRQLSASLLHASRILRTARPGPRRAGALNIAYRHAFRAALTLQDDYGATGVAGELSPREAGAARDMLEMATEPQVSTLPPSAEYRGSWGWGEEFERERARTRVRVRQRRFGGNGDLVLLQRSQRLPRLPLPSPLPSPLTRPIADFAERSAQLVQQRQELDAASEDMRDLHERLLNDMEMTVQYYTAPWVGGGRTSEGRVEGAEEDRTRESEEGERSGS